MGPPFITTLPAFWPSGKAHFSTDWTQLYSCTPFPWRTLLYVMDQCPNYQNRLTLTPCASASHALHLLQTGFVNLSFRELWSSQINEAVAFFTWSSPLETPFLPKNTRCSRITGEDNLQNGWNFTQLNQKSIWHYPTAVTSRHLTDENWTV